MIAFVSLLEGTTVTSLHHWVITLLYHNFTSEYDNSFIYFVYFTLFLFISAKMSRVFIISELKHILDSDRNNLAWQPPMTLKKH